MQLVTTRSKLKTVMHKTLKMYIPDKDWSAGVAGRTGLEAAVMEVMTGGTAADDGVAWRLLSWRPGLIAGNDLRTERRSTCFISESTHTATLTIINGFLTHDIHQKGVDNYSM